MNTSENQFQENEHKTYHKNYKGGCPLYNFKKINFKRMNTPSFISTTTVFTPHSPPNRNRIHRRNRGFDIQSRYRGRGSVYLFSLIFLFLCFLWYSVVCGLCLSAYLFSLIFLFLCFLRLFFLL